MQANAIHHTMIFYGSENNNTLTVAQYLPAAAEITVNGQKVSVSQETGVPSGEAVRILPDALRQEERPDFNQSTIRVQCEPCTFTIQLRLPGWLSQKAVISVNKEEIPVTDNGNGFVSITRTWSDGTIVVRLPKKLTAYPLPDRPDTVAFLDGPVALAGLVSEEHLLYGDIEHPETMLTADEERIWGDWQNTFRTVNQPVGFRFVPLYEIGYETYTVYFQVKNSQNVHR